MMIRLEISVPNSNFEDAHYHINEIFRLSSKPEYGFVKYDFYGNKGHRRSPAESQQVLPNFEEIEPPPKSPKRRVDFRSLVEGAGIQ